jgi:pimeloyl-ACP methyl ester carboxylesterase
VARCGAGPGLSSTGQARKRLSGREPVMSVRPDIVLVHGAWADGSCWSAVIKRLQADGYHVTAPQFPESSLAADVARLREVLARQDGLTRRRPLLRRSDRHRAGHGCAARGGPLVRAG